MSAGKQPLVRRAHGVAFTKLVRHLFDVTELEGAAEEATDVGLEVGIGSEAEERTVERPEDWHAMQRRAERTQMHAWCCLYSLRVRVSSEKEAGGATRGEVQDLALAFSQLLLKFRSPSVVEHNTRLHTGRAPPKLSD